MPSKNSLRAIVENVDVTTLTFEQKADACCQGTADLAHLMEFTVCPVIHGQIKPSDADQALSLTYSRIVLLLHGLSALRDPMHFQIANSCARTVFELVLDLKALQEEQSLASRFFAFGKISKFHKTTQLIDFLHHNPSVDREPHQPATKFATDPKLKLEIDELCRQYWGSTKRDEPNWPDHWAGKNIAERSKQAGIDFEEIYRSKFFLHSYYVHAGPAGVEYLSRDALIASFYLAHSLVQNMSIKATEIIGDHFHLFASIPDLRETLNRVSVSTGFHAVNAVLQAQQGDSSQSPDQETLCDEH